MHRTPSFSAQAAFNLVHRLQALSTHSSLPIRFLARAANKFARPVARKIGAKHTVVANVYGHSLTMPAEHPLPATLLFFPQYNRPLGLAIEAIASANPGASTLTVIDVGANIGDTAAIIEQRLPGLCSYLCIEPDQDMATICMANHRNNRRLQIEQCFIGEQEGALVWLEDDGRANPSTKSSEGSPHQEDTTHGRLVRLDTIAMPFADTHRQLSLIKIDTEGYDFSVLRSAPLLLEKYKPALFVEWFPKLLLGLQEEVWDGFEYLKRFGYHHLVFFTNEGDFYCRISHPDRLFLRSLAAVALAKKPTSYFDVFASTSESICNQLVELAMVPDRILPSEIGA